MKAFFALEHLGHILKSQFVTEGGQDTFLGTIRGAIPTSYRNKAFI